MAKLSRGKTFTDGVTYASADLHTLVDNATILPGAITEQAGVVPVAADSFMFYSVSASGLAKCTGQNIIDMFPSDAAANAKSLRTLGTSSTQAAPGNDSRFSATLASNVGAVRIVGASGLPSNDAAAGPSDLAFASIPLASGLNINWDAGEIFTDTYTGSANKTFTFSNVRDGRARQVILKTQGYTGVITWPTLLGTVPVLTYSATVHVFTFVNTSLGIVGVVKAL